MCPNCGAEERLGIWLTPKKVAIFDKIKRSGNEGVPYSAFDCSRDSLKMHIFQINIMLEETDYVIRGKRGPISCYRLVKR